MGSKIIITFRYVIMMLVQGLCMLDYLSKFFQSFSQKTFKVYDVSDTILNGSPRMVKRTSAGPCLVEQHLMGGDRYHSSEHTNNYIMVIV